MESPSLRRPPPTLRFENESARPGSIEAAFGCSTSARAKVVVAASSRRDAPTPGVPVVDLFCGAGGFSEGARVAGHHTVLAVDNDPVAMETHTTNHPGATHVRMELGDDTEARLIELIEQCAPSGGAYHLHGSPPCQAFSSQRMCRVARDRDEGMRMVVWFVNLVLKLRPRSWSLEEVSLACVDEFLNEIVELHPDYVDHKTLNMVDYGVPQLRKRTIAGPPHFIRALEDASVRVATRTLLTDVVRPPDGAMYIRAGGGRQPDLSATVRHEDGTYTNDTIWHNCVRPITRPANTITCTCRPVWYDEQFRTIRSCAIAEIAAWQSFPRTYRWPKRDTDAQRMIGNALPPQFAAILLRPLAPLAPLAPTPPTSPTSPDARVVVHRRPVEPWRARVRSGNRKRGRSM